MEGTDSALAGTLSVEMPRVEIAVSSQLSAVNEEAVLKRDPLSLTAESEAKRSVLMTDCHFDADFNSEPTPIFTLKQLSFQVSDGTVVGDGSITSENALEGDLLTQLQQLVTHPMTYRAKWDATEIQLIPLLSMFVQLPENLADSTGHLSSSGEFSGNLTDSSSLNLDSKIVLTEATLDEVKLKDSTLNCTIAAGELKIDGDLR